MGRTWHCENCDKDVRITTWDAGWSWGSLFKMKRQICPICGHKTPSVNLADPNNVKAENLRYCWQCGESISYDNPKNFCEHCGADLKSQGY